MAQLTRIVLGLDPGYSTTARCCRTSPRARTLSEDLSDIQAGRAFYRAAIDAFPVNAHILQHRGIFVMYHRHGSLPQAEDLARRARELDPRSGSISHTEAPAAERGMVARPE